MASAKSLAPSATLDPTTLPKADYVAPPMPVYVDADADPAPKAPDPAAPLGDRESIIAWLRAHRTAESVDQEHFRKKLATDIEAQKDRQ